MANVENPYETNLSNNLVVTSYVDEQQGPLYTLKSAKDTSLPQIDTKIMDFYLHDPKEETVALTYAYPVSTDPEISGSTNLSSDYGIAGDVQFTIHKKSDNTPINLSQSSKKYLGKFIPDGLCNGNAFNGTFLDQLYQDINAITAEFYDASDLLREIYELLGLYGLFIYTRLYSCTAAEIPRYPDTVKNVIYCDFVDASTEYISAAIVLDGQYVKYFNTELDGDKLTPILNNIMVIAKQVFGYVDAELIALHNNTMDLIDSTELSITPSIRMWDDTSGTAKFVKFDKSFITTESDAALDDDTNSITIDTSSNSFKITFNNMPSGEIIQLTAPDLKHPINFILESYRICFAEDSMVETDHGLVAMKDLTLEDNIKCWDFDNGCITYAKPLFISEHPTVLNAFDAIFDDGTICHYSAPHRCYCTTLNKFISLADKKAIGKDFYFQDGSAKKLVEWKAIDKITKSYTMFTNYHMNSFVDGILAGSNWCNIYEINNDMKYIIRRKRNRENTFNVSEKLFKGMRLAETLAPRFILYDWLDREGISKNL